MVIKLKEIADTPAAVDTMQSEEDQKQFVVTFRELTKYLQSLHTFIEFSFDQNALTMSEQEYQDYKSKYLMLYSRQKTDREVVSVLNDVDFCIELMESDRINVAYIMNLIRNIHFDDVKQKDYDIKHIKDWIRLSQGLTALMKLTLPTTTSRTLKSKKRLKPLPIRRISTLRCLPTLSRNMSFPVRWMPEISVTG